MKTLQILIATFLALIVVVNAGPPHKRRVPWYDCKGKPDGDYPHPYECTMYITCVAEWISYERDCPPCHSNPDRCPYGRDVFDENARECLWADETECLVSGSTTAAPPQTSSPTTEAGEVTSPSSSSSIPPTTITEMVSTSETNSPSTTTTTEPPPITTTSPTISPPRPKPGDPCDPDLCRSSGYCQTYLRCDKETRKLMEENCGEGLFWNPYNEDGTDHVHGGNCDLLENLSAELRDQYRKDSECLGCFWKATRECEQQYLYQPPNQMNRNVLTLSCSAGLVFSQEKQTCQRCNNVQRLNGTNCCKN